METASATDYEKEDDLKGKDDGMYLISEPGYDLDTLLQYVKGSCLASKCGFLENTDSVEEICKAFLSLLQQEELNLDEVTSMFVVACMCYYIGATAENVEWRSQLLQKSFQYVDTLSPMHIHVATKRLWEALKTDGIDYVFNALTLCHQMSFASETGRAVAICLVWAILGEITETEIEMYRFREMAELMKMLNELDDESLQMEENVRIVYILVKSIGFLVNAIVFGKNDDLKKAGYRNYFNYTRRDLERLRKYVEHLDGLLKIGVSKADNYWDLRMTISEYMKSNIIGLLQDKITEMQTLSMNK